MAERIHTEYDPLLGWINKKNFYKKNMYGPNNYLRTNSQRFRNNSDFDVAVPNGKSRWICSGDSFTLGYGVDNDHTWCELLTSIVNNIETVNMGQGGYGFDQAYLWYMRDGIQLEHDVLVFAFITNDIDRMSKDQFLNYHKPRLYVRGGKIIKQNVPVPKPGFLIKYFSRYELAIKQLNVIQLMYKFSDKIQNNYSLRANNLIPQDTEELTLHIIKDLIKVSRASDRKVLFVHLPTQEDFNNHTKSDSLRTFLLSNSEENGWFYIDLIDEFRNLDPNSVHELFIQKNINNLVSAKGHYTEKGNRYIADLVVKEIANNPSIAKLVPAFMHGE
ncbi:MAG: hypothetical protein ACYSWS_06410 [Planctomycetota bacterium]